MDVSKMKEGDFPGLTLLQRKFGIAGVKYANGRKSVVIINSQAGKPVEAQNIQMNQNIISLKAECDFRDKTIIASFFFSLNGK